MNEFGLVKPPIGVIGDPTRIYECEVVTVNPDTVSVQKRNSRAGRQDVPIPVGYIPVEGDRVLIADIDGDRRKPIIVQVLTSGYVPPAVIGAFASRPSASDAGAGGRYFATDTLVEYISTGTSWHAL